MRSKAEADVNIWNVTSVRNTFTQGSLFEMILSECNLDTPCNKLA